MWKFTHLTVTKCGLIGFLPLVCLNIGPLPVCVMHLAFAAMLALKQQQSRLANLNERCAKTVLAILCLATVTLRGSTGSYIPFVIGDLYSRGYQPYRFDTRSYVAEPEVRFLSWGVER